MAERSDFRPSDTDALKGVQRRTLGAEAIGDLQKVGLEDRLQHHPRSLLNNPVTDRRDTQRPLTTIWLGDRHTPHRRRTIRALAKSTLQLAEQPLDAVLLDRGQRQRIDTGHTPVLTHPSPRLPKDVTPADTVIQRVKTTLRGPLGTCP